MENKVSVREAYNYIWNKPDKWNKLLSWLGVMFLFIMISGVIGMTSAIPLVGLLFFPVRLVLNFMFQFFQFGYITRVVKISKEKGDELPEVLTGVKETMLTGAKYYLICFVYTLPISLILVTSVIAFLAPLAANRRFYDHLTPNTTLILMTLGLVVLLVVLVVGVILSYLMNAGYYLFLSKNDIGAALNFSKVWKVAKEGIVPYIIFFLKSLAIGWLYLLILSVLCSPLILALFLNATNPHANSTNMFMLIACCLMIPMLIIVEFIATVVGYYIKPHMLGQVFRIWDAKKLDEIK